MSLNQQQLDSIKNWVANGAGIGEVQTRIKDEFGVVMTYIDVRFLIDDIGAELVSKPIPFRRKMRRPPRPKPQIPNRATIYPTIMRTDSLCRKIIRRTTLAEMSRLR